MIHVVSGVVLLVLFAGFWARKRNRRMHYGLMLTGFSLDLGLLLFVELNRSAINRVVEADSSMVLFHAGISTFVLLSYFVMIGLGVQLLKGKVAVRGFHRNLAVVFAVLRISNFVTAFMV
ncbi:MAG: hypothetical protein OEY63_02365 [Gemmatimonadota bacterium]|nr:hypothetical protein [Gemmatimonadota bacterium]MDH5804701.1 hypothetical protein [Gemmatimonadota bacterium]